MSSTVRSYGFIAILRVPVSEAQETFTEMLSTEKSDLGITYDGKLLYVDFNNNKRLFDREDFYGLFIGSNDQDPKAFIEEAAKRGLSIDLLTLKPYNCIWYTGSDNPVNELTKEEFLRVTT